MAILYEARVLSPDGLSFRGSISNFTDDGGAGLEYTLGPDGVLLLTVPRWWDTSMFVLDARIGVWRSVSGRGAVLDGQAIYLVRDWIYRPNSVTVRAYHATSLLDTRIVAYDAGSTYTTKAAVAADTQIKAFARENLGSSISSANRDGVETYADLTTWVTVQPDLSQGASVAMSGARDNLWTVIKRICDASTTAGTWMSAEIVSDDGTNLQLRTYATARGVDRSSTSGAPMVFSSSRRNLANPVLTIERRNEITFTVAGGTGDRDARATETSFDSVRAGESPFNRREQLYNVNNSGDSATLQDIADAQVYHGRRRITIEGDVIQTESATRGMQYDYGDIVVVEEYGEQLDCRVDVHVRVGRGQSAEHVYLRGLT